MPEDIALYSAVEQYQNDGVQAHCRRVATWADEIASTLKLPELPRRSLAEACLAHHLPIELISGRGSAELLKAAGMSCDRGETSMAMTDGAAAILKAVHYGNADGNSAVGRLAEILEIANSFDEQLEMAPYEDHPLETIFHSAAAISFDPAVLSVLPSIRKASRAELTATIPKLPVFPATAAKMLALMKRDFVHLADLQSLVSKDQVLAGELLHTANSPMYAARYPVIDVQQALARMGTEAAGKVLLAASLRPLLGAKGLEGLWHHSIEAAEWSEKLARACGMIDPKEAFLAGLVHDVGRLAMACLPEAAKDRCKHLARHGCQSLVVEQLMIGMDHAEAGGLVLRKWNLPGNLTTAVIHHHEPERTDSTLAALLYLVEYWSASEEDLPSTVRLHAALARLGLDLAKLRTAFGGKDD